MDKNSINQFLTNLSQKVCEKRIDKHDMKTLEIISFSDEAYHRAMVAKLLVNSETKKQILLRIKLRRTEHESIGYRCKRPAWIRCCK